MFVLIFAGAFHEFGHAAAARVSNIRLFQGAFTEIETDELGRSSNVQKLRIFSAGIWHNIILALIGVLVLWAIPYCLYPFYVTGGGIVITDVNQKSGLYGPSGLQNGMVVNRINECEVRNAREWTKCLEVLHERQKFHQANTGYLVQYSKVLPMTASSGRVISNTASGEVQCCSEFENANVTHMSHICFQYQSREILQNPLTNKGVQKEFMHMIINPEADNNERLAPPTDAATARNRVRRANLKMRLLRDMINTDGRIMNITGRGGHTSVTFGAETDPQTLSTAGAAPMHACLPAVAITEHATCEMFDRQTGEIRNFPAGYVCVVPALYNGTALLKFQLRNRTRPVLFIGFLSEPLYMIDMMELTPRHDWFPFWIPLLVELFGKYLVTFSLAMGLLNAVPCYGLDGQFMCRIVVDYFFSRLTNSQRQRLTNSIVTAGTIVFVANVAIGMIKFVVR